MKELKKEKKFSWSLFQAVPLVGIVRNVGFEDFKQVLNIAQQAGLTTLEVTMNTPDAESLIQYANELLGTEMNIGVGTVCTMQDLERSLAAGAQFVVTPIISEEVIKTCVAKGVPVFPGAYTPTEIYKAWSWGAKVIKVFPCTTLGSSYIKDLAGPLSQIKLLPTGGVDLSNMEEFKKAGSAGFGMGGALFNSEYIKSKNWEALAQHIESYILKTKTLYTDEN